MAKYKITKTGYEIANNSYVDKRLVLTRNEMRTADRDFILPDYYFAYCPDKDYEGFYYYSKDNNRRPDTGKYYRIDQNWTKAISDIFVNGNPVVEDGIASFNVPTSTSELENTDLRDENGILQKIVLLNMLNEAIDSEARARNSEDARLQYQINNLPGSSEVADLLRLILELGENFASETNERKQSDSELLRLINSETAFRIAADSELTLLIDSEAKARTAADSEIILFINSEAIAREREDNRLEALIDSEAKTRKLGDSELRDLLQEEINRATSEEDDIREWATSELAKKQNNLIAGRGILLADSEDTTLISVNLNPLKDNETIILNSENELTVKNAVPDFDSVAVKGKALIVGSDGELTWGEAGKVDGLYINGHLVELNNKFLELLVGRDLSFEQAGSEFILGHDSEITFTNPGRTEIAYPSFVDRFGHVYGIRKITFGSDLLTSEDGRNNTRLYLNLKDANVYSEGYPQATLIAGSEGLYVNLLSNDYIQFVGNKLELTSEFWDDVQVKANLAFTFNSEDISDDKYPSTQVLKDQLDLKQDTLRFRWAIDSSENVVDVLYDDDTIILNSEGELMTTDAILPPSLSSIRLSNLIPTAVRFAVGSSENNILVDEETLRSLIASNLGKFIGTFQSTSELPLVDDRGNPVLRNDYAFVVVEQYTSEGSEGSEAGLTIEYWRYKFVDNSEDSEGGHWEFEFVVSGTAYTPAQWRALNSNWNENLTASTIRHINNLDPLKKHVTQSQIDEWDAKQKPITATDGLTLVAGSSEDIIKHTNKYFVSSTTKGDQQKALKITIDQFGHISSTSELVMYPPITGSVAKDVWVATGPSQRGEWKTSYPITLTAIDSFTSEGIPVTSTKQYRVITNN